MLRPRVAVISVGAHNDYGHPRADTLAALHARPGLAVYRTDESGRIVLESDGRSLTVRTERSSTVGPVSERPSLKPAYLISGSDRPKVETAVQRLRARFVPESVEIASALEASGADVVTLCNSGSLFGDARLVVVTDVDGQKKDPSRPATGGWKAADVEAVATYLAAPAPDTVLALVGLEVKKDAPIAKACAKSGDLLIYDVAKRGRVAWVAERFRQAGVKAEADACALLIEYVGEDDLHGLANEIDKIATWAQGEPVGVAEIEQLVSPLADVPSFALTDAWADRHPGHLLDLSETLFDRSDKPRRDTAPRLAATLNGHLTRMRQLKRLAAQGVPAARGRDDAQDASVLRREGLPPGRGVLGRRARERDGAVRRARSRVEGRQPARARRRAAAGADRRQRRAAAATSALDERELYAAGVATRRAAWAFLRPAVFLWIAPFEAALSIRRTSARCSVAIASASPAATAASSRFVSVLIVER